MATWHGGAAGPDPSIRRVRNRSPGGADPIPRFGIKSGADQFPRAVHRDGFHLTSRPRRRCVSGLRGQAGNPTRSARPDPSHEFIARRHATGISRQARSGPRASRRPGRATPPDSYRKRRDACRHATQVHRGAAIRRTPPRLSPRARIGTSANVVGLAHLLPRRFDRAAPKPPPAIQDHPGFPAPWRLLAAAYACMGRTDEA
jgi:hypothetical protein